VLAKLLINISACIFLLVYVQFELGPLVRVVAEPTFTVADLGGLRSQAAVHAGAALVALLVATTLSVYKPRDLTRYGWRKQQEQRLVSQL
jgi:hypothetical protein